MVKGRKGEGLPMDCELVQANKKKKKGLSVNEIQDILEDEDEDFNVEEKDIRIYMHPPNEGDGQVRECAMCIHVECNVASQNCFNNS